MLRTILSYLIQSQEFPTRVWRCSGVGRCRSRCPRSPRAPGCLDHSYLQITNVTIMMSDICVVRRPCLPTKMCCILLMFIISFQCCLILWGHLSVCHYKITATAQMVSSPPRVLRQLSTAITTVKCSQIILLVRSLICSMHSQKIRITLSWQQKKEFWGILTQSLIMNHQSKMFRVQNSAQFAQCCLKIELLEGLEGGSFDRVSPVDFSLETQRCINMSHGI